MALRARGGELALMPRGSKVASVEAKLKKEYPAGTKNRDAKIYGTLNKAGLMKGSKVTDKGRQKEKK